VSQSRRESHAAVPCYIASTRLAREVSQESIVIRGWEVPCTQILSEKTRRELETARTRAEMLVSMIYADINRERPRAQARILCE